MLTDAELSDLTSMVRSGQASLLRRVSGMTLAALSAETGINVKSLARYEEGTPPRNAGPREAYYRVLCALREAAVLASAEPCERVRSDTGAYRRVLPQYRRKRMPRRAA